MNKFRVGKDGNTPYQRRTGCRWRKPVAQSGEKVWFREIGEGGRIRLATRMLQCRYAGTMLAPEPPYA